MKMLIPIILTVMLIILMIAICFLWKKVLNNLRRYEKNTENIQAYNIYKTTMKKVSMMGVAFIIVAVLLIIVVVVKKI